MIRCADSHEAMLSPFATALPPAARISSTTFSAALALAPSPWTDAPRSLTTTLAPSDASSRAIPRPIPPRSEEHTSELQSLMRISYAVFCLQKKKKHRHITTRTPDAHKSHKK